MTTRPATTVTTADVEHALGVVARIVAAPGGEVYVPIFERLERELAERRQQQDAIARARALVAARAEQERGELTR